ncbi:hypothetical protein C8K36_10391 [Rhodococcus sp. OK519]|uniref:hypothetical protein n=1 Tax=Rhodococcus sp. OK519 TaxID=2135729 RepID=UPI000D3623B3|nr:hypothetical protein C8K36_10391 [Rhodococcus sp. OK519]
MTRADPAPDAPDVLDHLHRRLDLLLGDHLPGLGGPAGFRSAIASAKLFVLDERAQHSGFHISVDAEKR